MEVAPGTDPAVAGARLDALIVEWKANGPSGDEVARVATRIAGGTIRGLEQVGGFGGKGQALAEGAVFAGDPGAYRADLAELAAATPASVRAAAARFLGPGVHRVTLKPGPRDPVTVDAPQAERVVSRPAAAAAAGFVPQGAPVDRTAGAPAVGEITRLAGTRIERARLSNGMAVQFVRNDSVPVVRVQLAVDGGHAVDSRALPGTQRLMLATLREGTDGVLGPLDGPEIARRLERLGASVSTSASLDRTRFALNALAPNLAASLALFADIVAAPTFPQDQVERVRGQLLAAIANEAVSPEGMALRAAPPLIFGAAHPYGQSFSGNGTEAGVKGVTRDDLRAFHAALLQPAKATLLVVGDTSMAQLMPLLEARLGRIRAEAPPLPAPDAVAPVTARARILLLDRPGAPQAFVLAGAALPLTGRDDTLALELANDVFGGLATSRLMKRLREEKGWSYGASSSAAATWGNMPFLLTAPVDRARTGESIAAIRELLGEWRGARPPEAGEVDRARNSGIRSLPAAFETGSAVLGEMERAVVLGRPDDWLETLPARLGAVPLDKVRAAPLPGADALTWIVVGDSATILPQLKALGMPVDMRAAEGPSAR
jgi:predicted Zn-dependent peptidase